MNQRHRADNFVAPAPRPRVEVVEVQASQLPAPSTTVLLPYAGYEDRARGFGLAMLTLLCYECDEDDRLCKVDGATGRVLVPLPWGKQGYAKWGLTSTRAMPCGRSC